MLMTYHDRGGAELRCRGGDYKYAAVVTMDSAAQAGQGRVSVCFCPLHNISVKYFCSLVLPCVMDIFGNNFIQLPKSKTVARYEARLWWPQALSYSLALLSPSIAPLLLLWSSELNTTQS